MNTVTFSYLASPACGLSSGVKFSVLSQASSCGIPTEIVSQPTVSIVAGSATRLTFDGFEKIVPLNKFLLSRFKSNQLRPHRSCEQRCEHDASAVVLDPNTGLWINDPSAQLSLSSNFSSLSI